MAVDAAGSGNGAATAASCTASSSAATSASRPSSAPSSTPYSVAEASPGDEQRVALAPAVELAFRPVGAGVAARVPHEAVGQRLHERGPLSGANRLEGCGHRLAHRPDVVAVDGLAGDPHHVGARLDASGGDELGARVLAVDVVLAHVERGEREDLRVIEALVEVRLVDRPVTEERDRDTAAALERERRARRGGNAAPDDPEAADQAVLEVDHVHRAGATAAHARCAAEQLVEQALRLEAERKCVTVAAVRACHAVVARQQARNPDLDRLLTRAEMRRAVHVPLEEEGLDEVLEATDHEHATVEVERQRGVRPHHAGGGRCRVAHREADSSSAMSAPRT